MENKIDKEYIKSLLDIVDKYNLEELAVEEGDVSVSIKGASYSPVQTQIQTQTQQQVSYDDDFAEEDDKPAFIDDDSFYAVKSPLVGVFYSSPSPSEPSFVSIGDRIEIGTELGLIEAMKVFSPIPSDISGEVVSIDVKSGELVTEGQTIMKVKKED